LNRIQNHTEIRRRVERKESEEREERKNISEERGKNQTKLDIAGVYGAEKKKDLERFHMTLSHEDRDAFWERMSKIDVEERQNAATEE
jgi:hypothetical protein